MNGTIAFPIFLLQFDKEQLCIGSFHTSYRLFALWNFIRRLQFSSVYKVWFPINVIFILIFSICSYTLSRSEDLEYLLVCPLPAFAIIPASLVLDGYANTFQGLHEESPCVLRSMQKNLLHPYCSINHKIFPAQNKIFNCLRKN